MSSFSESGDVSDTDSEEERRRSAAANGSGLGGTNGQTPFGPGQKDLDWYYDQEVLIGHQ